MAKKQDLNSNSILQKSLENIEKDRSYAESLLRDISDAILRAKKNDHRDVGLIASRYLETLQKSNEQYIKVAQLLTKKEKSDSFEGFSGSERDNLFNSINEDD